MQAEFWVAFEKLLAPARSACAPYRCYLTVQRPTPPAQGASPNDEIFLEE